jgi:antitoxin component HigA of HigAB toxin-antitoxin module
MINNETEYKEAVKKLEALGDDMDSDFFDEVWFDKLTSEIEAYEKIHYHIGDGSPEEIEKLKQALLKD